MPGTPDAFFPGVTNEPAVLVVDDDRAMALMLVDLLRESGQLATAVHSVEEALGCIEKGRFGLIVSDLQMHPLSGVDLLDILEERAVETPVILMSAFPGPEVEGRALAKGARAFLSKPFDTTRLLDLVASLAPPIGAPP